MFKDVDKCLTNMDKILAKFYGGDDDLINSRKMQESNLRREIAQDVGTYIDECGLNAILNSKVLKGLKNGIYSVIVEGVEHGE